MVPSMGVPDRWAVAVSMSVPSRSADLALLAVQASMSEVTGHPSPIRLLLSSLLVDCAILVSGLLLVFDSASTRFVLLLVLGFLAGWLPLPLLLVDVHVVVGEGSLLDASGTQMPNGIHFLHVVLLVGNSRTSCD